MRNTVFHGKAASLRYRQENPLLATLETLFPISALFRRISIFCLYSCIYRISIFISHLLYFTLGIFSIIVSFSIS